MDRHNKPLAGKRIVVTRSPEDSGAFLEKLQSSGAQVLLLPCVEFLSLDDPKPLDCALSRLAEFDWVVFTSRNAVRFFSRRLRELGKSPRDLAGLPKIAAIGAATSTAATGEGLRVDFVASSARSGREFVSEFSPQVTGKRILIPHSDQADSEVAEGLHERGAQVTSVVAYRTCMPESLDGEDLARIRREGADVFVFASPSAFWNFAKALGAADLKRFALHSAFAAIGPTTARAIRGAGVPVAIEAAEPSTDEIVNAMSEYFSKPERAKVRR